MPMVEALVESATRLLFHVLAARRVARVTTQRSSCRPHPGTQAQCRAIVVTFDIRTLRNSFVLGRYLLIGSGIARALSCCSEAAGIWWPRRTPQPTSSERPRAYKTRAAHFRCLWPAPAPRAFVGSLGRRVTMSPFDTLPGESNAHLISSIINLVCPQCGGRMAVFQCEGRCRRNWLAEWEWANQATRSPKSRRGHPGRSMR
jgi:hypothetical protein